MHFDFLLEMRKTWKGEKSDSMAGHFPLLVIELNGKTYNQEEQKERDEYKRGVCEKLKLPIIFIKYDEKRFSQEDLETDYLGQILIDIFKSVLKLSIKNKSAANRSKLLEQTQDEILEKYSIYDFPDVHYYVHEAYNQCLKELS